MFIVTYPDQILLRFNSEPTAHRWAPALRPSPIMNDTANRYTIIAVHEHADRPSPFGCEPTQLPELHGGALHFSKIWLRR